VVNKTADKTTCLANINILIWCSWPGNENWTHSPWLKP